jgi:hypothetical protein
MYRYSFDSSGNYLGSVEVNPISLYARRGLMALALILGLWFLISQGCHSVVQAGRTSKPQLESPQIQLPL